MIHNVIYQQQSFLYWFHIEFLTIFSSNSNNVTNIFSLQINLIKMCRFKYFSSLILIYTHYQCDISHYVYLVWLLVLLAHVYWWHWDCSELKIYNSMTVLSSSSLLLILFVWVAVVYRQSELNSKPTLICAGRIL